jgi:hypothetical protein
VKADPSHPQARRWKAGLSEFRRDITRHIRSFLGIYRSFFEGSMIYLEGELVTLLFPGTLRSDPRLDTACSRLGWLIEQELLLYFWHKQRWDPNACIQYTHLHREHRHHPWVQETLFRWTDAGDERRVLQLLGLRALQSKNLSQTIEEALWRMFVREAVGELVVKGMSVRKATGTLAGKHPQNWPVSQRLLTQLQSWTTQLGHNIGRSLSQKTLESVCYPRPTEESWRAFCTAHHVYRGHLRDCNSLPPFPTSSALWNRLLWKCRYRYMLPVIRPPDPFDLPLS